MVADQVRVRWRDVPAALWSRRTWLALAHLVTGGLLWLVPTGLVLVLIGWGTRKRGPLGGLSVDGPGKPARALVLTAVAFLLAMLALFALTSRFTAWQRARFRLVLGEELVPFTPPPPERRHWRRLIGAAVTGRTWQQAGYHALVGAFNAVAAAAVVACALLGLTLIASGRLTEMTLGAMLLFTAP